MIGAAALLLAQSTASEGVRHLEIFQIGRMAAFEARCARDRDHEWYLVEAAQIEFEVEQRLTPEEVEAGAGGEVHPSRCLKGPTSRYWRDEYLRAAIDAKSWLAKETRR